MGTGKNVQAEEMQARASFTVRDYNAKSPFAGFLPGLGGKFGIPTWVFYVNRGQGVCSFGAQDKDHAFMEYLPATHAYQLVNQQGFRTFLNIQRGRSSFLYEPFQYLRPGYGRIEQDMTVSEERIRLRDFNYRAGLETTVEYFSLLNENLGGLVRTLVMKNQGKTALILEVADGLPVLLPYGLEEDGLKNRRYLMEAFLETQWLTPRVPLFKLKIEESDSPEVNAVHAFHFGIALEAYRGREQTLRPLIDPGKIFGSFKDFSFPKAIPTSASLDRQVEGNQFPCFFTCRRLVLAPGEKVSFFYLFGRSDQAADLKAKIPQMSRSAFFERKSIESRQAVATILRNSLTVSRSRDFDAYCRQNYLDNVMRGGFPDEVGSAKVFYLYGRKHGDLERDYNKFNLPATYCSQGAGNYRDVNQNRRNDIFFLPCTGEYNIKKFMNLIQLDGFNPLLVKEVMLAIPLAKLKDFEKAAGCTLRAAGFMPDVPFIPGEFLLQLETKKLIAHAALEKVYAAILEYGDLKDQADFGEGYWTDHWTYNLDLIDSFLAVFPDRLEELFFGPREYIYFDSSRVVLPRSKRFRVEGGRIRQFHSVQEDETKKALIQARCESKNALRTRNGVGMVYRTNLAGKLVCLAVNKLASLDPSGIGVEMEADKPNWYDALNGLPAQLGSSVSETFELKRLLLCLDYASQKVRDVKIKVPVELYEFYRVLIRLLTHPGRKTDRSADFIYWDHANTLKEDFRKKTKLGISGLESTMTHRELQALIQAGLKKCDEGIRKAFDSAAGIYRTYFTHDLKVDRSLRPRSGSVKYLPFFLEGNVHALRLERDREVCRRLHRQVKKSALFDAKLKMYKVNASLAGESFAIGRTRGFTPGWLENESIWLHMEYKYLLELLRTGLYTEFFSEIRNTLVPFLLPETYGRSIYENSSFIVSSVHPDTNRHGKGYYARLSGSTAEFIHMWLLMCVGPTPFFVDEKNHLHLSFRPLLPSWLFTEASKDLEYELDGGIHRHRIPVRAFAFMFLGKTLVVVHNPSGTDTFAPNVKIYLIRLWPMSGTSLTLEGGVIPPPFAARVRNREFAKIELFLK
jgi:hypothetical protein